MATEVEQVCSPLRSTNETMCGLECFAFSVILIRLIVSFPVNYNIVDLIRTFP